MYGGGSCTGTSQYWENYWWSRTPGKEADAFGPEVSPPESPMHCFAAAWPLVCGSCSLAARWRELFCRLML